MDAQPAAPLLEVRDVSKSFGAVAAVRGVSFPLYAGEAHALVGENGAGKSTLVKMLAGVHRPDTGTLALDGADVDFAGPADAQGRRHRGDLPGADALPGPVRRGEHLHGPPAARRRCGRIDRGRDARPRDRAVRPARRAHRPRPAGPRPVDRRPADRRDRQGAVLRGPGPGHGRADRRAVRRRGRAAVRGGPLAARRGRRGAVHLAPLRGDLRALPAGHDHARRPARLHRAGRRPHRRRAGPPDGRPRPRRALPQAGRHARRGGPRGRGPDPRRACSPTSSSACGPARSSRWPAWSAPAAAR